jgi:hypothetical protein
MEIPGQISAEIKTHWMFGEPRSKFLRLEGRRLSDFETDPNTDLRVANDITAGQIRASPPVPPGSIVAAISF